MNRTTYLALAFVVVASGYAMLSGDDKPVSLEIAVLSETPLVDNPKSNELPKSVNTKKEDPVVLPREGNDEEIDPAYQYQMAVAEIEAQIELIYPFLDVDGNSKVDPLTDGLLIVRYLFELRGNTLILGVIATDAIRRTSEEIEAFLSSLTP